MKFKTLIATLLVALACAATATAKDHHSNKWWIHASASDNFASAICNQDGPGHAAIGPFDSEAACNALLTPPTGCIIDDGQLEVVPYPNFHVWYEEHYQSGDAYLSNKCPGYTAPQDTNSGMAVYLCHGTGHNPVVWSNQEAAALLLQGDWFTAEAELGYVPGGDNVGTSPGVTTYHLTCNNKLDTTGLFNTATSTLYIDHNGATRDAKAAAESQAGQYPIY